MPSYNLRYLLKLFDFGESDKINSDILKKLAEWNLIPKVGEYLCPHGHALQLVESPGSIDNYIWRCRKKTFGKKPHKCNVNISIRKNTFLDKAKLSVMQIVIFVYMWTEHYTQSAIMKEVEISRPTAVDWCNICREVVYNKFIIKKKKIGGPNQTVEVDESKFGKRKYQKGHHVEGQWVFGGVERKSNKCFLIPVETRDKHTLLKIIKEWILPGTTIVSDFWKAYDCLADEGYTHFKVNHSIHFKDPETKQHTNTIEGLWRHAKYSMPQYHKSKKYFSGYLAKFMFLRYCKHNNFDPFTKFLSYAGNLYNPLSPQFNNEEHEAEESEDDYEIEIEMDE